MLPRLFPKLPFRIPARTGLIPLFLLLALILGGCQSRFPAERIPRSQWLVLPLDQPPAMATTPRAIRGWLFSARTIRQNPRAGDLFANMMSRRLATLENVQLFSTVDLRYYHADKREAITENYPYLEAEEVDALIAEVPDIRFGRELGADKILTGRIIELHMGENRTIHWWWSKAEIELSVIDVATEEVLWTRRYYENDQFASQLSVLEEIADEAFSDLKDDIFWSMAR